MSIPDYPKQIIDAFSENADPIVATQMEKYMKNQFAFYGIKAPLRKALTKTHWKIHGLIPEEEVKSVIPYCWNLKEREMQYFAMESLGKKTSEASFQMIDTYIFMIRQKSWWDTVDYIASHLVGSFFTLYPEQIDQLTDQWLKSGNIWLQRTCLLYQLKYNTETDNDRLEYYIQSLISSNNFFIRKAIGWILREYSKTDHEYVIRFVQRKPLSGLSEREALKWVRNKGLLI